MKINLILESLKNIGRTTDALLGIVIGGQTYQNLKRKAFYPTLPRFSEIKTNERLLERRKSNFYVLLSQLKKQGFIEKKKRDNKSYWLITALGKKKLNKLKSISGLSRPVYKKEKDDGLNIVIFDIPEKEKAKRNWLRQVLLGLGFSLLQKSVWAGRNKLPKRFLGDLDRLNLTDYIHIFRVSKSGTL